MKMKIGHYYRCNDRGQEFTGQYIGDECDFSCCVCDKGHKAKCFNVFYSQEGYETWGFGKCHMPEIIEDLGEEYKQEF